MLPAEPARRRKLLWSFAAIYFVWGSTYLVGRIGVLSLPVFLFVGLRFATAGVILLTVSRLRGERVWPRGGEWRDILLIAFFSVVLSNGTGGAMLKYVPSNVVALLNASAPLCIVLVGMLGARAHRPSRRTQYGLLLGFAGTLLVIDPGAHHAQLWPQLVVMAGVMCWAVATLLMRNQHNDLPLFSRMGQQMLWGGLALASLGAATGEIHEWHWSWEGGIAFVYLTVLSSCLAHTAYAWLSQHTTPAKLSTYGYVNPLLAMLLGWLVLGETLAFAQIMGAVIVLLSVALLGWPAAASPATAASHRD